MYFQNDRVLHRLTAEVKVQRPTVHISAVALQIYGCSAFELPACDRKAIVIAPVATLQGRGSRWVLVAGGTERTNAEQHPMKIGKCFFGCGEPSTCG